MDWINGTAPYRGPSDMMRQTRERVDRLSQEVSSGRSSDVGRAVRADFSRMSHLAQGLDALDSTAFALRQAERWADTGQSALQRAEAAVAGLSEGLTAGLSLSPRFLADRGADALRDVADALNVMIGPRAVFGGGGTEAPIPDIAAVIDDVAVLSAGATDWSDYVARIDAYFGTTGPFETTRLVSGPAAPVRFPAGDDRTVDIDLQVSDPAVLGLLKQAALVSGVGDLPFEIGPNGPAAADIKAGFGVVLGTLPQHQGRLGAIQAMIGDRLVAVDAERSQVEIALADAVGTDPFEAATRLQQEMSRLESLYAITARRSRLRLTDYL
jgi:flagellar hook-associated protein 3 FlgL